MRGRRRAAIAGAMRRAPPWGRRTPHRGSRPGVRAGGRRRGLPPARDVVRAPAPSSARGRSKARGRRAVAAGGARSAPPAPLGHCPVCVNPMRRRIELRLFQGAAAAPALRGLGRCGLSAADVRAHFESGHFHPDPPLLIATLVDLLSQARAEGGPAAEDKETSLAVGQPTPQTAPGDYQVDCRHRRKFARLGIAPVRQSDHRHPAQ